jgi:hypothetical protein
MADYLHRFYLYVNEQQGQAEKERRRPAVDEAAYKARLEAGRRERQDLERPE